jgi:hypothetical protein
MVDGAPYPPTGPRAGAVADLLVHTKGPANPGKILIEALASPLR